MVDISDIRAGMQVLGSDGGMVGRVIGPHGDHIHVEPDAPEPDATEHLVPNRWVSRIDEHVHLDRPAALVRDTWGTDDGVTPPPPEPRKEKGWIVWAIGAVLLLFVIILGVRACGYAVSDSDYEDSAQGDVGGPDAGLSGAAAAEAETGGALNRDVEAFLASSDDAPRAFAFSDLAFADGSAEIRSQDRRELTQLGRMLADRPEVTLRVVGRAGDEALATRRAEAVAAALIANGVSTLNIETEAGEGAGATELVILSR